mmetsp:Transcript_26350/g.76024  ORF Transcript_26350/g.76024 Transcript_26350/m.76024 type:complete len:204 (-) Transcript_26350:787-1398(-)
MADPLNHVEGVQLGHGVDGQAEIPHAAVAVRLRVGVRHAGLRDGHVLELAVAFPSYAVVVAVYDPRLEIVSGVWHQDPPRVARRVWSQLHWGDVANDQGVPAKPFGRLVGLWHVHQSTQGAPSLAAVGRPLVHHVRWREVTARGPPRLSECQERTLLRPEERWDLEARVALGRGGERDAARVVRRAPSVQVEVAGRVAAARAD